MSGTNFDTGIMINSLMQLDSVVASTANNLKTSFETQLATVSTSFISTFTTATTAFYSLLIVPDQLATAFNNLGMSSMAFSVGLTGQVGASISELIVKAEELQSKFNESAVSAELCMTFAFANITLSLAENTLAILGAFTLNFEAIKLKSAEVSDEIKKNFKNSYETIEADLITAKENLGKELDEIKGLFSATADSAKISIQDATVNIQQNLIIIGDSTKENTDKAGDGWFKMFDSSSTFISHLSGSLSTINGVITLLKTFKGLHIAGAAAQAASTSATVANTGATAAAGVSFTSAALGALAFGAGMLLLGGGILLAASALALLAKVAFNAYKLLGLNTHGVKAADFDFSFSIPGLADGGFPSMGQMFIAREAGPELVGTIGSRSAVVNNDQIVESVSAGVYRAVKAAMGQNGGGVIQLILDGTKVAEVVSDNVNAITRRTGRCPILV